MEFIDSPAKASVVGAFVKNRKWLGISKISELSGTSACVVWRLVPTLLRYGIVVQGRKGKKYRAYKLNDKSRLARTIADLYAEYEKAVPVRGAAVKYEELKRSKNKNLGKIIAAMDAFEARRGGRPKSREEILALAAAARKAWKNWEASGAVVRKDRGLKINVD